MNEIQVSLRLLGGTAVVLHCPRLTGGVPHRDLNDIDCVLPRSDTRKFVEELKGLGYLAPDRHFNALRGDRRMIFEGPAGRLDVIVHSFEMCHRIELTDRLGLDYPTITVTDLLITKLQVVELNGKDCEDIALLLDEHEVGHIEGDTINVDYIAELASNDWGLWRTITGTLEKVKELKPEVALKAQLILEALELSSKSRRFAIRAKIGDRKRWYELPDETTGI